MTRFIEDLPGCPICQAPFLRRWSIDYSAVSYGSPEGHDHDDNAAGRVYQCRKGHWGYIRLRRSCPTAGCDWRGSLATNDLMVGKWPEAEIEARENLFDLLDENGNELVFQGCPDSPERRRQRYDW